MRLTVPVSLALLCFGQIFGQSIQKNPIKGDNISKSYPIDGTPLLQKQYQQAAEYVASHPDMMEQMRLQKVTAWNFQVGDSHTWWVYSYVQTNYYQDQSTCRGVGKHCYIFVEDSLWGVRVTQPAIDSIENNFDNKTPADPNKGIYVMDSLAFGTPPDVDNDPKIIILVCNIQDGYNGTGGYVAGFFDPRQETAVSNSNDAEIYYLDANPTDLTTAGGIQSAMSTAAHEFQHMINWNYHKTNPEPTFINESCSKLAEVYCGYPLFDLSLYANETNHYLFDWRTNDNTLVLNDYARAQRFSLYLWDRFGIGIFKYIVQSSQTSGIGIVNDALTKDGLSVSFNSLFLDWLIANELNDTTANRLYGYAYPNLPASNGENFYNPNESGSDIVQHLAADYLVFKSGSNLNANFTNTSGNSNLSVTAIEIGSGSKNVVQVPFGSSFSEPGFGTTYSTVAFVIINEDPNNSASYSYQASGVAPTSVTELKWDTSEPSGYYGLTTLDTVCVTFDAYPQGVLDSVRVALRRAGSINGGVYQSTGVQDPTPLGKFLTPITATISTTSPNIYPVPYKNWATIDLTLKSVATDNPFAVAFVIGSNSSIPGVMVTDYPGANPYHSYTYLSTSDGVSAAGWYYLTSSDTTVGIYLIRAYVSLVTGVKQVVEVLPTELGLSQNYPNPFNPTTTINYHLPFHSFVTLRVYDILGREVATLVNANQNAGVHTVTFDAHKLPSGVYFYRVTAGNLSEVRKLVLEK
jgi:hypothetical protein